MLLLGLLLGVYISDKEISIYDSIELDDDSQNSDVC